ncbi:adenine-specific DNA-methyltransferase [Micromonospora vinacea]|uniref:Adenine-specific DNA-methyltransferase n=1 Tax=Micromonospora vinacea TaxID=709878 RepID=A0ABS0JWN3_9ACTN|nr:DNA methyltransferase [Micromonospora vinacea]MBG6100757.1 adenine-specific DNA-methyltransferase [Micromonospora vinacea]
MAHIDNLVASIADPALREALQAEIRKLAGNRQLGLVFNEHKPESVLLYGQTRVRKGDKVQVMADGSRDRTRVDDTGIWRVAAISGDTATLVHKADPAQLRQVPRERCVVTREFGDPVFPGLRSTGKVERGGDKTYHTVINGENFHVLQALQYPYAGKVDAIYIDPPYNTGARDWKYNNDYVDDMDPYRHSKWLSFMQKRLELAKELLNPESSVLIVTIDEKEVNRLGMLLDQVFPRVTKQLITIVINPNGSARRNELARVEEYAYFLSIGNVAPSSIGVDTLADAPANSSNNEPVRWERLLRGGDTARRADRPNLFYPVFVDVQARKIVEVGDPLAATTPRASVESRPGCVAVWPLRTNGDEGRWRVSASTLRSLLEQGHARLGAYDARADRWSVLYLGRAQIRRIQEGELLVVGRDDQGAVVVERGDQQQVRPSPKTVWNLNRHRAGEFGSSLLRRLLPDRSFPFPKSLYAVEDCLRMAVAEKPEALVVDFFAGSGTTTHALMRLNKQDGGKRRSISVTNNEVSPEEATSLRAAGHFPGDPEWEALGICEYITVPRITAAVTGMTSAGEAVKGEYKFVDEFPMAEGLAENVEFFELTYEDPNLVSLGRKFQAVAPLLWLMACAQGERIDSVADAGWAVPDDAVYGVLFAPEVWSDFVEAVNARAGTSNPLTHAFVVTDSETEYRQIIAKLPSGIVSQQLYRDYLRNFEINAGR